MADSRPLFSTCCRNYSSPVNNCLTDTEEGVWSGRSFDALQRGETGNM
jgi:hypothetical protein